MKPQRSRDLSGKTIVIIGASSGIGRATAIAFAKKGASLVVAARRMALLEELAEECLALGAAQAVAVPADVTVNGSLAPVAEAALALGGNIDVWINNAGIGAVGEFDTIPMDVHDYIIKTSLTGHLNGAHAVLPVFKEQGFGVLINTSSVGGWTPEPYAVAYSAAKYGIRGFSDCLRCELRHFPHIHVCDVFPAYIDTPGFQHGGNYIGKKLKPVPPVYPASRVARAMVRLAQHPKRHTIVGGAGVAFKTMQHLSPTLTRNFNTGMMENYFLRAKPAPVGPGQIFEPYDDGYRVSGGWLEPGEHTRVKLTLGAVAAAGIAGLLLYRSMTKKTS